MEYRMYVHTYVVLSSTQPHIIKRFPATIFFAEKCFFFLVTSEGDPAVDQRQRDEKVNKTDPGTAPPPPFSVSGKLSFKDWVKPS
jgi:hypothetical protein